MRGTLRESATPGVAQKSPTLMPLTAKRASSAGHREVAHRDQLAACGGGKPVTRAITGTGSRWIASITAVHWANRRW